MHTVPLLVLQLVFKRFISIGQFLQVLEEITQNLKQFLWILEDVI